MFYLEHTPAQLNYCTFIVSVTSKTKKQQKKKITIKDHKCAVDVGSAKQGVLLPSAVDLPVHSGLGKKVPAAALMEGDMWLPGPCKNHPPGASSCVK